MKILKKKLKKIGLFFDSLPEIDELENILIDNQCILIIDDYEDILTTREKAGFVTKLANFLVHHRGYIVFIILQSYQIFYARHRLNSVLYQATSLILFRSINNFSMLKRFLNSYDVQFKSGEKLYNIFKKFVNAKYKYLILNVSPHLNCPLVYSNVLFCDPNPLILFN